MSNFAGFGFDWQFGNPKRSIDNGCVLLTGQAIVLSQIDLDGLFSVFRPVTRRAAGDPQAGGTAYVDHWGPDPSADLTMTYLDGSPLVRMLISYKAILSAITLGQSLPLGVHFLDLEFTLLDAGTPLGAESP